MKKCIFFICTCCVAIGVMYSNGYCKELGRESSMKNQDIGIEDSINHTGGLDYTEIQEIIDDANITDFNFKEEVNNVMEKGSIEYSKWFDKLKEKFIVQLKAKKSMIIKVAFLILFSAIITSFAQAIGSSYVSETSFLVVYLILMITIFPIFKEIYNIGLKSITQIKNFIEVLVPTYTVASFIGTGINTATAFSQITMIIIVIIEQVFIKILLPLINIYLVVLVINNISEKGHLNRMADLIMTVVKWGNKVSLGVITAIATIKKLIAPTFDMTSKKMIGNGIKLIPYVGNSVEAAKDTVISAGYLIKNAMGGISIITIILICMVPIINLVSYIIIYELISVISEPIADNRIINAIKGVANGGKLLLEVLFTSAILLIISVALLAS